MTPLCKQIARNAMSFLLCLICFTSPAKADDDCNPTTGDQLYGWVHGQAGQKSRALAKADYNTRSLNYMVIAFQNINKRTVQVSSEMDNLEAKFQSEEANNPTDDVGSAVLRSTQATSALNDLFVTRSELDTIEKRHAAVLQEPTQASLLADGQENVGRETLILSFQDMGDTAASTLATKFSISVSITVNDDGSVKDESVNPVQGGNQYEGAATQLAIYYGGWYGVAAVAVYELGKFAVKTDECERKVEHQRAVLRQAMLDLPAQLIRPDEQLTLYHDLYRSNLKTFADYSVAQTDMEKALDQRWRTLFALNAAREAAANSILTTAKIDYLRTQYENGGPLKSIFDATGLADTADKVANLNAYLANGQQALLRSCGNVEGFTRAEDQADSLAYSSASIAVFNRRPEYAPLQNLLDTSGRSTQDMTEEAHQIAAHLAANQCRNAIRQTEERTVANYAQAHSEVPRAVDFALPAPRFVVLADASDSPPVPSSYCEVESSGGSYYCGNGGQPYGSQFSNSSGDPRQDVLDRTDDGGYAADNRKVGGDIAAAEQNINDRINRLNTESGKVGASMKGWVAQNSAALASQEQHADLAITNEKTAMDAFGAQHATALANARQELDAFLNTPQPATTAAGLANHLGTADLALTTIPADSVPPGIPALPGITAAERAFGTTATPLGQAIIREQMKVDRDLVTSPSSKALATRELNYAKNFDASPGGTAVANALLSDSRALRFFATHQLSTLQLTGMSNSGELYTMTVPGPDAVPSDALSARIQTFLENSDIYDTREASLRAAIGAGAVEDSGRAGQVDSLAQSIYTNANATFYSGDLPDGARMIKLATAVLDVGTRFVPGVNLGRDVYEAFTGKDLFSGDPLDATGRTMAVLGIISLGFEDEVEGGIQAIRKIADLGEPVERAEEIVAASRSLTADGVKMSQHALDEMPIDPLGAIDQTEVNDAINQGTHFWDTQNNSLVAFENGVAPGEKRVAAAMDIDASPKTVNTVFRDARDDDTLEKVVWGTNGRARYIKMPPKAN
jgi:hypothetical protein